MSGDGPWRPNHWLDDALEDSMPVSETHLWGTLRGMGRTVCPVRSVLHEPGARGRRLLWNVGSPTGLRLGPEGGGTARGGAAVMTSSGATGVVMENPPDADGAPWRVELDGRTLQWTEGNLLDLTGAATGPAMWWELGQGSERMAYRVQVVDVRGTVAGSEVSGFLGLDRVCMQPGQAFYQDDPVAVHHLLVAFYSFANEYSDGSIESGSVIVGHDGLAVATVTSEGETRSTNDVTVRVHRDAGYWPTRIEVLIAGERWEWTGDESDRFVGYGQLENPQSDGVMRRVGDDRPVVRWFAQGETVPAHGNEARTAYRPGVRVSDSSS